jgi:hypothetical protein
MEGLSLIVTVIDKEQASWIWDLLKGEKKHEGLGIEISALSNGNLYQRNELNEQKISILEEHLCALDSETEKRIKRLNSAIEKTWERNI